MKIVIAPNAFKNSINALNAATIIKNSWLEIRPKDEIIVKPMADGGDGFAEIVGKEKKGIKVNVDTKNALGEKHIGYYYKVNQATAVIDLASNCGMQTIEKSELNALESNTEGLGIVIHKAIEDGCKEIILGLGGSASTDFGFGALYALGLKCFTSDNNEIVPNGRNLDLIQRIDTSVLNHNTQGIHFFMAIDVQNKLIGTNGTSQVFAPQKGANQTQVELLEYNISHIGNYIQRLTGKDVFNLVGGGAAGGCAAGFWALINAEPMNGSQFMMEVMELHQEIENADLVITAEGKLDDQSIEGKIPFVIGEFSKKCKVPCINLVGINQLSHNAVHPFYSILSINQNWTTIEDAIKNTSANLSYTTKQVVRLLNLHY